MSKYTSKHVKPYFPECGRVFRHHHVGKQADMSPMGRKNSKHIAWVWPVLREVLTRDFYGPIMQQHVFLHSISLGTLVQVSLKVWEYTWVMLHFISYNIKSTWIYMHLIPLCELVQKGKVASSQNKKPTKESFHVVYTLLLFCHWALWRMVGDESTVGQLTLSKWKFSEEWLHDLGNWNQKSPQTDIWISPRTIPNLFGNDPPTPMASATGISDGDIAVVPISNLSWGISSKHGWSTY